MDVSILTPGSPAWPAALASFGHDVYHLPGYAELAAGHEGGQAVALLVSELDRALLMPLLLREAPLARDLLGRPFYDAASPYGYPGALLSPAATADEAWVRAALGRIWTQLAAQQVVTLFLRLHPFLEMPLGALADRGLVVEHGPTVGIPLDGDDQEILARFRKGHRRVLQKARQQPHDYSISSGTERLEEFIQLYYENMDRVGASRHYYFSREYFHDMFRELEGKVHLAVLTIGRELAVADLFTEVSGIVQSHLGATSSACLHLSPSVLLTFYQCLWARDRGDRIIHLGGGLGGREDSLFQFKAGFSRVRFTFRTFRGVVDRLPFERIWAEWQTRNGYSGGDPGDQLSGYFPAYRSPAPSSGG